MSPDGRLDLAERFHLVRGVLVRRARLLGRRRAPLEPSLLAELELPEGPLVAHAHQVCLAASGPWLVNHCLRTFVFGAALARRDGLTYEPALAATACLLHDLGLTPAHEPPGAGCFAVHGGEEALRLLLEQQVPPERARVVQRAIALHLDLEVPLGEPEARVVHEGAALDVYGGRFKELAREARAQALARYPRLDMKARLVPALARAAERGPRTRIGQLAGLGFLGLVAHAPFDS